MEPASTGVIATFGLNAKLFVAQLINFSIVLFVMWKFVYTPLLKMMDKRAKEISDGLANAKAADQRLIDAEEEKARVVNEARSEARAILEDVKAKAEAVREEKLAIAKREIEKHIAEAKVQIKSERENAAASLRHEVAGLVLSATRRVASKLDEKQLKTLATEAVEDIQNS